MQSLLSEHFCSFEKRLQYLEIKDFSALMLTESLHFFLKEKHETANDELGEMKCITIGYSKNC